MAVTLQACDVRRIYQGDLTKLPRQESNVVRIFLSSTFTDYSEERNHLMRHAIPKLKSRCLERGIDFQIADMRWGVRDDAQIEHKTTNLCINEINKCRGESRGPYFVAFLGNKYGYRPYPSEIDADEFVTLVRAANTAGKDAALLEKWFKKDENVVPPVCKLLPITTHFPYYNDDSEENEDQRTADRDQWSAVNELLASTFRIAADLAFKYGRISADDKHKYFRSVTETEIATGILDPEDVRSRTICFRRKFDEIKHSDKLASRFEDLEGGLPDTEAEELLDALKFNKIPQHLSEEELVDSSLPWTETGVDPDNTSHSEYLQQLSEIFHDKVSEQIRRNIEKIDLPLLDKSQYNEVLHHAHFCNNKLTHFRGREELLSTIKSRLLLVKTKEEILLQDVELPGEDDLNLKPPMIPQIVAEEAEGDFDVNTDNQSDDAEAGADGDGSAQQAEELTAKAPADAASTGSGDMKEEPAESIAKVDGESQEKGDDKETGENKEDGEQKESPDGKENEENEDAKAEQEQNGNENDAGELEDKERETMTPKSCEGSTQEERPGSPQDDDSDHQSEDEPTEEELAEEEKDQLTELQKEQDMVKKAMKDMGVGYDSEMDDLPSDVLLEKLLEVPEPTTFTQPVILHGESGSGKTSVMAKVACMAPKWLENESMVRITRFLGTSPKTSSIKDAVYSICQQIIDAYEVREAIPHQCDKDFSTLALYFTSLLARIDTKTRPLLMVLDSVDQLSSDYQAFGMSWVPVIIPEGIHLVISLLPDMHNCLENLQQRLNDPACFVEVPKLPRDTATDILNSWLKESHRKLTTMQREFVLKNFMTCSQPLYLKVAFEQAKQWTSYSDPSEWVIGPTIRSAIEQMFIRLEKEHGQVLVSKALAYLTTSKSGVSDAELEDILSLDDAVLQDTYLYHLPANPELIRLPPLLWKRLKYDLVEYLVERESDEKVVVTWYHRQFRETALKRYVAKGVQVGYHHVIGEYFQGKWANAVKPLELFKKKKGSYPDAMRGVPEQPLQYSKNSYNHRALNELPHHLLRSGRFGEFVKTCCSYDWIHAKSKAFKIFVVILDLKAAISVVEEHIRTGGQAGGTAFITEQDKEAVGEVSDSLDGSEQIAGDDQFEDEQDHEAASPRPEVTSEGSFGEVSAPEDMQDMVDQIRRVMDVMQLCTDFVSRDPNNLAAQILGQLGNQEHPCPVLEKLRVDAREWVRTVKSPVLSPQSQCLPAPGKWLKTTLNFVVSYPGDATEDETKFSLSMDGKTLFGLERTRNEGDNMKSIDTIAGEVTHQQMLRGINVRRVELVCNDRYLRIESYVQRDKYSPKLSTLLFDLKGNQPVMLPPDTGVLACSKLQSFLVIVGGGLNQDFLPGTEPDQPVLKTIAQIYDLDTKKQVHLKTNVRGNVKVTHAQFGPDEKTLVLTGESKVTSAFVFTTEKSNPSKYKHRKTILIDEATQDFSFSKDSQATGLVKVIAGNRLAHSGVNYKTRRDVYICDISSGQRLVEFNLSEHYSVDGLKVSTDLRTLVAYTHDGTVVNGVQVKPVTVIDAEQLRVRCTCPARGPYSAVAFCGDRSDLLLTCTQSDSVITAWFVGSDAVDGIGLFSLNGHAEIVTYLQVTPDNKRLISASSDNTIKFWSLEGIVKSCDEAMESVEELVQAAYGGDKQASEKIQTKLDPDTSRPFRVGEGQQVATATTVSKNGKIAAVGTNDGWLIFYDLSTLEMITYYKEDSSVHSLLTTKSGRYVISAAKDIKLWDPETAKPVRTLDHGGKGGSYSGSGGGQISCLDESCDILVGGYGGMECFGVLWDLNTGKIMKQMEGLYGFSKIAITSDAKKVVTTFFECPMIYNVDTGQPYDFGQPDSMMSGCSCVRISPDDRMVVTCSTDGSARVSDIATGAYKFRLQHKSSVVEATFAPDSSVLLTSGFRNVLVWSMQSGQLLYTMSRHQDFITRMRFCGGGRFLVTASKDKEIVVWDFKERVSVASFLAHCPLLDVSVAEDLSSILYAPVNVAYIGVLQPNGRLQKIIKGRGEEKVLETVRKAQAFALAFSSQKVADKSSRACSIL